MYKRCISLTVVVLALFGATRAAAYCLFSPPGSSIFYSWNAMPISYQVSDNLTDPQLLMAIDAAFKAWEDVACSTLDFSKQGQFTMCTQSPCPAGSVEFNHTSDKIYVFWFATPTGFPGTAQNLVDVYTFSNLTGDIIGASIAINAFNKQWNATGGDYYQNIYDLQNEMTAFVGSVIGLTDSAVPGSTMIPTVTGGDTDKRTLSQDDIDGIVYIYKEPGCPDPPAPGPDGCYTPPTPQDAGPAQQDGGADAMAGDLAATDASSAQDASSAADAAAADDAQGGDQDSGAGQGDGGDGDTSVNGDTGPSSQAADDGCCRASYGRDTSMFWILGLGLGLLLALRRRKSRGNGLG